MHINSSGFLTAGLAALALSAGYTAPAYSQSEHSADDMPAEAYPQYVFACPDGKYQSGCDREDIENAIALGGVDASAMADSCLYQTAADCSVLASGRINRATGAPTLHWQMLSIQPSDGPHTEMMVLAELDGPVPLLLLSHQVDGYFNPPVVAHEGDGRFLLHVPALNGGLGNADLILFTSGLGWNLSDAETIRAEIDRLLPGGFSISSPISFNFRESSAFGLVRREDDAGCCATGGVVNVDFEQSDNDLAVTRVSFQETELAGRRFDVWSNGEPDE